VEVDNLLVAGLVNANALLGRVQARGFSPQAAPDEVGPLPDGNTDNLALLELAPQGSALWVITTEGAGADITGISAELAIAGMVIWVLNGNPVDGNPLAFVGNSSASEPGNRFGAGATLAASTAQAFLYDGAHWDPISISGSTPPAGGPELFSYTVTGLEPDLAAIPIVFGSARGDASYLVIATMQAGTDFLVPMITTKTDAGFVLALSANATAGDVWAFYVADPFTT
jgi:hypothetical protein